MSKQKVKEVKKEIKSSIDTLAITNHMRCAWGVPHELRVDMTGMSLKNNADRVVMKGLTTQMCAPNETVLVSKEAFDKYRKGCVPFQYLLDAKRLVCKKKVVDVHALKRIETKDAPDELLGIDENVALLDSKNLDHSTMSKLKPING